MMRNIGRPKKEGIDNLLKVKVSDEAIKILENVGEKTKKTKSDLIRELIPIISSKDFEGAIPNTSMEVLQAVSEECWNVLHTENALFKVEGLSKKMPAFITTFGQPIIYVKYPTFKIQIFDGRDLQKFTDHNILDDLLKEVGNISNVYATKADYLIVGNRMQEKNFPFVAEVMCLEVTLEDNTRCKDKIVEILRNKGYNTTVYPSYCIRGAEIELLEEGQYFKVI